MGISDFSKALDTVIEGLKSDEDLAWGWHCNIAMAIYDEDPVMDILAANKCASQVMRTLFGVDITKFEQYRNAVLKHKT